MKNGDTNSKNLGNLNLPHFFGLLFVSQKVREFQVTQFLIVSITISYIFCALVIVDIRNAPLVEWIQI